jgi:nitrogen fixation/metabolism regulation signal transduction histidine kinase
LIDAGLMGQVFVNLFLNAKTPWRPVPTADSYGFRRKIHCRANCGYRHRHSPEHLEKIYDPFFTTKANGIGLGLAVVARILEQHQAQIAAESQPGRGTKFTITLSLAPENGVL